MDHILQKEGVYKAQLSGVRDAVLRFVEPMGWRLQSRGRRAHVSVHGPVRGLNGVMDIEMEETDWEEMPDSIQPATTFLLWCSGSLDRDDHRYSADTELFWRSTFEMLSEAVDRFLPMAWEMLTGLTESNLLRDWPGPAQDPYEPPEFGPPRRRGTHNTDA